MTRNARLPDLLERLSDDQSHFESSRLRWRERRTSVDESTSENASVDFPLFNEAMLKQSLAYVSKHLSHTITKLALSCKPPGSPADALKLLHQLENLLSALDDQCRSIPPSRGKCLNSNVAWSMCNLYGECEELCKSLRILAKNEPGSDSVKYLITTGMLWDFCSELSNMATNDKEAVEEELESHRGTLDDVIVELSGLLEDLEEDMESSEVNDEKAEAFNSTTAQNTLVNEEDRISRAEYDEPEAQDEDEYPLEGEYSDAGTTDYTDRFQIVAESERQSGSHTVSVNTAPSRSRTARTSEQDRLAQLIAQSHSTDSRSASSVDELSKMLGSNLRLSNSVLTTVNCVLCLVKAVRLLIRKVEYRCIQPCSCEDIDDIAFMDTVVETVESLVEFADDMGAECHAEEVTQELDYHSLSHHAHRFVDRAIYLCELARGKTGAEHSAWFEMCEKRLSTLLDSIKDFAPSR